MKIPEKLQVTGQIEIRILKKKINELIAYIEEKYAKTHRDETRSSK